jgi:hypothetical protein
MAKKLGMQRRTFWVLSLSILGLLFGANLASRLPANALVQTSGFHQPSITIDQLSANAQNLPMQSFDAF